MAGDQAAHFEHMGKNAPRATGEACKDTRRHFPDNGDVDNINQR